MQMKEKFQPRKRMQVDYPELVRKTILHKWQNGGKECWNRGKVIRSLGYINLEDCEFELKYINDMVMSLWNFIRI